MKLKDIFGICGYAWYGFGGHQSIGKMPFTIQGTDLVNADGKWVSTVRAAPMFKLHRMFIDSWIIVPETNPPFTLKTEPTEQNFYFDSFFKLQKANGITNIASISGCFDWYVPQLGSFSQRKTACYNPNIAPSSPAAWQDLANLCKLIAERYRDNGLLDYIQVLNEWDFRWNVPHVLTPEEYAVGFKVCYEAIKAANPNQKVMSGCTLNADITTAKRFIGAFGQLYHNEGNFMPTDWTFTVNNYIRTGDANQGNGIGATPEEVDRYGVFFKPLNDLCEQEGLTWAITETGYNTSPSTSASAMKNKAPTLEGFTLEEAQGILAIRTALICASLSKCVGLTFYHIKDGYEAEPFTFHGFNYDKDFGGKPDWSAKPARTICENFLATYGDYEVQDFTNWSPAYFATLKNGNALKALNWTDKKVVGGITPMPTETQVQPPVNEPITFKTFANKTLTLNGKYNLKLT